MLTKGKVCEVLRHDYVGGKWIKVTYVYIYNGAASLPWCFVSAVVISLYEEPIQPQQAASVVEKLGDYLITCGY